MDSRRTVVKLEHNESPPVDPSAYDDELNWESYPEQEIDEAAAKQKRIEEYEKAVKETDGNS